MGFTEIDKIKAKNQKTKHFLVLHCYSASFSTYSRMPSQTRKAGRSRSYKIHDNGGRPFTVDVNEHQRKLSISVSYPDSKTGMSMPPTHFKDYTFKRIWIGDDIFHFGKHSVL